MTTKPLTGKTLEHEFQYEYDFIDLDQLLARVPTDEWNQDTMVSNGLSGKDGL
jgi:hypothetical protein